MTTRFPNPSPTSCAKRWRATRARATPRCRRCGRPSTPCSSPGTSPPPPSTSPSSCTLSTARTSSGKAWPWKKTRKRATPRFFRTSRPACRRLRRLPPRPQRRPSPSTRACWPPSSFRSPSRPRRRLWPRPMRRPTSPGRSIHPTRASPACPRTLPASRPRRPLPASRSTRATRRAARRRSLPASGCWP